MIWIIALWISSALQTTEATTFPTPTTTAPTTTTTFQPTTTTTFAPTTIPPTTTTTAAPTTTAPTTTTTTFKPTTTFAPTTIPPTTTTTAAPTTAAPTTTTTTFKPTTTFAPTTIPPTTTTTSAPTSIPPTTTAATTITVAPTTIPPTTTSSPPLLLNLQAVPDYPVTQGQDVVLRCVVLSGVVVGLISWERQASLQWSVVGTGAELRLTHPEQNGGYRCKARNSSDVLVYSEYHYVLIVSTKKTVLHDLGLSGFVLSILALVLVLLFWLLRQKFSTTAASLNIPTGVPYTSKDLEMAPPVDNVYMNYSGPNDDYAELDPSTRNPEDGVYTTFKTAPFTP